MHRRVIEESLGPLLRVSSPDHIRWPDVARVLSALTLSDLGPFALKRSGTGGTSTSSSSGPNYTTTSPSRQLAQMGGAAHNSAPAGAYRDLSSLVAHEYAPLPPALAAYSAAFTTPAPMSLFDVEASYSHTAYNRSVWSAASSSNSYAGGSRVGDYRGAAPVVAHAATATLLATPVAEVSLFVLPPGRRMQMHDHPGQHVMCRVLDGRLQDVSIDWALRMHGGAADAARSALDHDLANLHASYFGTQAGRNAASQGVPLGPHLQEVGHYLRARQANPHAALSVPSFQTVHDGVVVRTATHLGDADRKSAAARAAATGDAATAAALSTPPGVVEFSAQSGGGVLHEFSAPPDAPAIFVDVIAPPYFAAPWHIDCNYYKWRGLKGAGAGVQVGDGVVLGFDETTNMVFDDLVAV